MTITPQQAQALLEGTIPGPWEWVDCDDDGGGTHMALRNPDGEKALHTVDAESYASWVEGTPEDLRLAAAAPDLAHTIAEMRWEYGVEQAIGTTQWFRSRPMAEAHAEVRGAYRLVRRLVGPVEDAE